MKSTIAVKEFPDQDAVVVTITLTIPGPEYVTGFGSKVKMLEELSAWTGVLARHLEHPNV